MDVGALSLLITESGFTATMQKVAQLDSAAAKVGAQPTELKVVAPTVTTTTQAFTRLQQVAAGALGDTGERVRALTAQAQGLNVTSVRSVAAFNAEASALRAAMQQAGATTAQFKELDAAVAHVTDGVVRAGQALGASGKQLGPATPEAAARFREAAAATDQLTASMVAQSAVVGRSDVPFNKAGAAAAGTVPKFRSAANGIAALAFAATSQGTPSLQSMALAAGLVSSSLLEVLGVSVLTSNVIGAAVVGLSALIGVVQRLNAEAKPTAAALEHIGNIDRVESYNRALKGTDDRLAALIPKMTAWERFRSFNPLVNLGLAPTESEKQFNQLLADREALVKRGVELQREQAKAIAAAQREAAVSAANDQLTVTTSLIDRQESLNGQGYALGIINLRDYFDKRVKIAKERSDAEMLALEARRKAESTAPVGEKPDEAIARGARLESVNAEIEAAENRRKTAAQAFLAEQDAAERALAQKIAGYERQRLEAQGQTHAARMQQIDQEVKEFERTLAIKPGVSPEAKAALANSLRAALTTQEDFNDAQRESGRIFAELATTREAIQQRVDRGQISELEGERQIAAAERARLPELQKIAAAMLAFATQLKNPELIEAARKLNVELGALGARSLKPLEQQFRSVMNELERAADEGDKMAGEIIRKLNADLKKSGGKITIGFAVEADALNSLRTQIQRDFASMGLQAGDALGGALSAGIAAALTHGSDKNFFEAFGNVLMQGLGGIFTQMGAELLTYGLIMTGLLPFLSNPFTSGPAAIAAGVALVAAGAALGAIATNNSGHRTGGAGAGQAQSPRRQALDLAPARVILDPDRRLRAAQSGGSTIASRENMRAATPGVPFVLNANFFGTPDSGAVRFIAEASKLADGRNIKLTRTRR